MSTPSTLPVSIPRHARVLPSFAVAFVSHALPSSLGPVDRQELLAWQRPGLPSMSLARELRGHFVRRNRARFDALWNSAVGVRFPDQTLLTLTDIEAALVRALLAAHPIDRLPLLTLRQVKEAVRVPVVDVLGLLAKVEAVEWIPNAAPSPTAGPADEAGSVAMDADLVAELRDVVVAPWFQNLDPGDVRFPSVGGEPLSAWVPRVAFQSHVSAPAAALLHRLVAAHRATWRDEVRDLAACAIDAAKPRPGSAHSRERWLKIFGERFGEKAVVPLDVLGERHGITRERVRQVCENILQALRGRPVQMPALQRVLDAAERVMPLPTDDLDEQIERFLGPGSGIRTAMDFADAVGWAHSLRSHTKKVHTRDGLRTMAVMDSTASPSTWIDSALTAARRDVAFIGCAHLVRVAGMVAIDAGVAVDLESLQAVLSKAPGYRQLGKSPGWFTLVDSEQCSAAARIRKLLSVSQGVAELNTVVTALAIDDRWFSREGPQGAALPPMHVFHALFTGWDWLDSNAHNRYRTKTPLDPALELSETEFAVHETLLEHEGVATKSEVLAGVARRTDVTSMSVDYVLGASPTVLRIEQGLYAVQGRSIPSQALTEGRKRRAMELRGAAEGGLEVDLSKPVKVTVRQSGSDVSLARRVVYLPAYLSGKITGDFLPETPGMPLVRLGANHQIRGLAKAADAIGVGSAELFEVTFDVSARTYAVRRLPGGDGAQEAALVEKDAVQAELGLDDT